MCRKNNPFALNEEFGEHCTGLPPQHNCDPKHNVNVHVCTN